MEKVVKNTAGLLVLIGVNGGIAGWLYEGEFRGSQGDPPFGRPYGVIAREENVFYTSSTYNHKIYLVRPGSYLEWGGNGVGPGQFNSPAGVALAPNGNVYVCDNLNYRVQYFTPLGLYLGDYLDFPETPYGRPIDIEISRNAVVYITFTFEDYVRFYNLSGSILGSWGGRGLGNGQFNKPQGIAITPTGNVYIADMGNDRIQYFTPTGSYLGQWGRNGSGPGEFINPMGVALAPGGSVFVTDFGNYRVQYFTASASFLGSFGTRGSGPGEFESPGGIALSPSGGVVYVTDRDNNRVQWFRYSAEKVTPVSLGKIKASLK